MNIHEGLEEHFKNISTLNGVCLNLEEQLKLEIALNTLHMDIKSDEMWFWGKITGVEKDYYVAVAIYFREHLFPKKKFYFCNSNNFLFSELPETHEHHLADVHKYNAYFIGNPDIILQCYEESESNATEVEEGEDVFKPKLRLKNLTESDRLSYVIRSIDFDCSVVPQGAFKMLPVNELRRNDNFLGKRYFNNLGLSSYDLHHLSRFMHFRMPQEKDKLDLIATGDAVFKFNFMDSLDQDSIKGI
jgi:radial spoke head protein 9